GSRPDEVTEASVRRDKTGAWADTGAASKAEHSSENSRRRIGPSSGGLPNTAPTRANCKSPPYPRTTSRTVPSRLKPTADLPDHAAEELGHHRVLRGSL